MTIREVVVDKNGGGQFKTAKGYQDSAAYQITLFNDEGYSPVPIVSAMFGVTDKLITAEEPKNPGPESIRKLRDELEGLYFPILEKNLGSRNRDAAKKELGADLDDLSYLLERGDEKDKYRIHAKGERQSAIILAHHIKEAGFDAIWFDGYDVIVATPNGTIIEETFYKTIPEVFEPHLNPRLKRIPIACGFGAKEASTGNYITLGRNTSDLSGAAVAKGLKAIRYEVLKEEPTVYMIDPKFLKNIFENKMSGDEFKRFLNKFKLSKLSSAEGVELTSKGAKVVYPMAIDLCEQAGIPIIVKNLDSNGEFTLIEKEQSVTSYDKPVAAMHASIYPIITVTDRKMAIQQAGRGYAAKIAQILADHEVDIINTSDSSTSVTHIISKGEHKGFPVSEIMGNRLRDFGENPQKIVQDEIGYLVIVGEHMRKRDGTTAPIISLLHDKHISMRTFSHCDEYADTPALNIGVSKEHFYPAIETFCEKGIFFKDFWKGK